MTVGALVLLSIFAWAFTAGTGADDMTDGILTRPNGNASADGMGSMAMGGAQWGPSTATFLLMWTVMMIAMMFPATSPVVLIFDRWRKSRNRTPATTVSFVLGYLVVWSAAGLLAYALMVLLDSQFDHSSRAVVIGGAILIAAGIYQVSPLKSACLIQCRSPLSLIMKHGQELGRGLTGPFRVGLGHGAYCLGCCWALMAVLIALGVMNLGWMAAVAAVILAEKVLPHPRITTYAVGVVLVLAGVVVVTTSV